MMLRLMLPLVVTSLLAACGDLPEPFIGNPGATARRLAQPPTPMLAVQAPSIGMADPRARDDYADLLALSLQKEEIPSAARAPRKGEWGLVVSASRNGDLVVPHYTILDPAGKEQGAIDGAPFSETSWTAGAPRTLGQAAQDAVPKVLALMLSIRATRDRANPDSLLNRAAKLYVPIVTGAPGDGNTVLTRLIRSGLAEFGPLVQPTPEGTDFTVKGEVKITPLPKLQQQVEIAWTVTRPSGAMVGRVSQLNAVAAGSLNQFWGDVAVVVAQEASGGINQVVQRFIGRGESTASKAGGPGAAGTASGEGTAPGVGTGSGVATGGAAANPHGGSPVPSGGTVAGGPTAPGAGSAPGVGTVSGKGSGPGVGTATGTGTTPGTPAAVGKPAPRGKTTARGTGTAASQMVPPGKTTSVGTASLPGVASAPGAPVAPGVTVPRVRRAVPRTAVGAAPRLGAAPTPGADAGAAGSPGVTAASGGKAVPGTRGLPGKKASSSGVTDSGKPGGPTVRPATGEPVPSVAR